MNQTTSCSGASSNLQAYELAQAQLYVDEIRRLNEEYNLEAGQLYGMSRILRNAERVLSSARAAAAAKTLR